MTKAPPHHDGAGARGSCGRVADRWGPVGFPFGEALEWRRGEGESFSRCPRLDAADNTGHPAQILGALLVAGLQLRDALTVLRDCPVSGFQLLLEIGFHLARERLPVSGAGDGQLVGTAEDGELALELARRLNPATRAPEIDELAARRSNTPPADVSPLAYVADSSPDEPEMGDDGYHDGP